MTPAPDYSKIREINANTCAELAKRIESERNGWAYHYQQLQEGKDKVAAWESQLEALRATQGVLAALDQSGVILNPPKPPAEAKPEPSNVRYAT